MKFTYNITVDLQKEPYDSWKLLLDKFPEFIKPSAIKPKRLRVKLEECDPNLELLFQTLESCGFEYYSCNRSGVYDKSKSYYEVEKRATIEENDIKAAEYLGLKGKTLYSIDGSLSKFNNCICLEKKYCGNFRHAQGIGAWTSILIKDDVKSKIENSELTGYEFREVYVKFKESVEVSDDVWELRSHVVLPTHTEVSEICDFFPAQFQIRRSDLEKVGYHDVYIQFDKVPVPRPVSEPVIVSKKFYNFWDKYNLQGLDWDPLVVKEDV